MARILLTIPTWNEAEVIGENLNILERALKEFLPNHEVTIEVADNGSTDTTRTIIKEREHERLKLLPIPLRGKGHAIKSSWLEHAQEFDAYAFIDADLAASLQSLPALLDPILYHEADLVCGSRFIEGARVERGAMRELASHLYHALQTSLLNLNVKDAQCGFKAASPILVRNLIPECEEKEWLFDTECIARAVKAGYRIKEIPVSWIEHRNPKRRSAIHLWKHGFSFLTGLLRIRRKLA